jgi:hypothetical protein
MPDEKNESSRLDCRLCFNEVKETGIEQKFAKMVELVEENKKIIEAKIEVQASDKIIVVDSDNFGILIDFSKNVSLRIFVNEPQDNKAMANEMFNKFLNYINSVLIEEANGAMVACTLITRWKSENPNLASKMLGEARIAKVNELAGESLRPVSIGFDFKSDNRDFLLMSILSLNGGGSSAVTCSTTYKDKIPFNVLDKELSELEKPLAILKKLKETEM